MPKNNSLSKPLSLIDKFAGTPILVIGDLMLDCFIWGDVSRISPEAPVPVLEKKSETMSPGGAGNVINNLTVLGAEVFAAGIVGDDTHGNLLRDEFAQRGVHADGIIIDPERPTTVKTRVVARQQQVIRIDVEKTDTISRQNTKKLLSYIMKIMKRCKAVVLSDYGKCVITPALLNEVIPAARRQHVPITVDPKIEHFQRYRRVTCMTPNLREASMGMHQYRVDTDKEVQDLGKSIIKKLNLESLLITRGDKGMELFFSHRDPLHIPVTAQEVFDVTGAGDTVIAVLSLCLACGADISTAAKVSSCAAGIVVGKVGTATVTPAELAEKIKRTAFFK